MFSCSGAGARCAALMRRKLARAPENSLPPHAKPPNDPDAGLASYSVQNACFSVRCQIEPPVIIASALNNDIAGEEED